MFSFGMIKTATALGGAILYIRDESLRARMRCRLAPRPVQRRAEFVRRVLVSIALVILSNRYVYDVFVRAIACRGDLDELLHRAVRAWLVSRSDAMASESGPSTRSSTAIKRVSLLLK